VIDAYLPQNLPRRESDELIRSGVPSELLGRRRIKSSRGFGQKETFPIGGTISFCVWPEYFSFFKTFTLAPSLKNSWCRHWNNFAFMWKTILNQFITPLLRRQFPKSNCVIVSCRRSSGTRTTSVAS